MAPIYLANTTCTSETGAVIRGSKVPLFFSSAMRRMVITGGMKRALSQKRMLMPRKYRTASVALPCTSGMVM